MWRVARGMMLLRRTIDRRSAGAKYRAPIAAAWAARAVRVRRPVGGNTAGSGVIRTESGAVCGEPPFVDGALTIRHYLSAATMCCRASRPRNERAGTRRVFDVPGP